MGKLGRFIYFIRTGHMITRHQFFAGSRIDSVQAFAVSRAAAKAND
jgi:hypothetical protein